MKTTAFFISVFLISSCLKTVAQKPSDGKFLLRDNWTIQSSSLVKADGKTISLSGYKTTGWYPTSVPSTVLAALVTNKVYPDPYYGTNINDLPGAITGRGREMPAGSPYTVPWWYRTEFNLPEDFKGKNTWIKFHSINYQANVWINGKLVADTTVIEGAYGSSILISQNM
jgi:exo-1,4-beta-D-glucosaminidase